MNPALKPAAPSAGAPIVVVGEALVDVYPDGSAVAGGAPFNVARWLAAFGAPVLLLTRVGRDDAATRVVRAEMQRFGLRTDGLQIDPVHPTGVVQVLPDPATGSHRFEIAEDSAWDHIEAGPARALLQANPPAVLVFGTLALRHPDTRATVVALAGAATGRALRFVDLNLRQVSGLQALAETALGLADWVKVNDEELQQLLSWFVCAGEAPPPDSEEGAAALRALTRRFGVRRWLVTCGAQGWYTADGEGRRDGAGPAETLTQLADTVGAGDAFAATALAGLARGRALGEALRAANRMAAAVCSWRGAMPADDALIAHWRDELGFGAAPQR